MNNTKIDVEILKDYDDILTISEMRKALKIGRNKAYELLQNGTITSIKIGKSYRISKLNIINYLQNQK